MRSFSHFKVVFRLLLLMTMPVLIFYGSKGVAHILWSMCPSGNAGVHTNTLCYQIVWEGKIGCSKLTWTCAMAATLKPQMSSNLKISKARHLWNLNFCLEIHLTAAKVEFDSETRFHYITGGKHSCKENCVHFSFLKASTHLNCNLDICYSEMTHVFSRGDQHEK